jgi:hypothetical protein
MTIQATIQAAIATLGTLTGGTVAVRIGTTTGTGLKGAARTGADLMGVGEKGETTGRVYLSRAVFPTQPSRGQPATVAGVDVILTEVRADSAGAMWVVEYQQQRPVEGV